MNEAEKYLRKQLRRLRYIATSLGYSHQAYQIMFSRWPESQARAILEGPGYKLAASMVVEAALLSGVLRWDEFQYLKPTGLPATREDVIEDLYKLGEASEV